MQCMKSADLICHIVSSVATTQWMQHNQTLPLPVKGVAYETNFGVSQVYKKNKGPNPDLNTA